MQASLPFEFDFKNPDYIKVFDWRIERLKRIRENPSSIPALKRFYKDNIVQFILDWGCTADPRNIEINRPTVMPFMLFPRQVEWIEWLLERWKNREPGLCDKSREVGVTWLCVAASVSLCLFNPGMVIGFGSRKKILVDKKGDPDCIFHKIRQFISFLPPEFRGGFNPDKNSVDCLVTIPETDAKLRGEAGANIGRGGRTSIYFRDEAAWIEHPEVVDAALSQTTNCNIEVSTPNGSNNPFARRRHNGKISVFSLHWRDDPRKDDEWYQKTCRIIDDPVIVAQEIDLNYSASTDRVLIPSEWVQAAVDAHIKLGLIITGTRQAALDIADEGRDVNAFCGRHGILVEYLKSFSGKNSDIYETVEKSFSICDEEQYPYVYYDADGLGAGVRGDARKINSERIAKEQPKVSFIAFRGSGAVVDPEKEVYEQERGESADKKIARKNEDFFVNAKAQGYWALRRRFLATYRAVVEKREYNPENIISLSRGIPEHNKLITELSQPTYSRTTSGKILVDKMPDGARSPNHADALMISFAPKQKEKRGWFDVSQD